VNALDLARWQFGIVTVYHFFFVPITIGLAFLVALLQTAWVRTGKDHYLRAVKFWGSSSSSTSLWASSPASFRNSSSA
jgi:cytochrome bd ubiquinol oxidase subunit I